MSGQETLQEVVQGLRAALPDVHGALVATSEGMTLAHSLAESVVADRVAAVASTALRINTRLTTNLELGGLERTSVFGSDGHIYLYRAGAGATLAVLTPHPVAGGPIHDQSTAAARRVAELVGG